MKKNIMVATLGEHFEVITEVIDLLLIENGVDASKFKEVNDSIKEIKKNIPKVLDKLVLIYPRGKKEDGTWAIQKVCRNLKDTLKKYYDVSVENGRLDIASGFCDDVEDVKNRRENDDIAEKIYEVIYKARQETGQEGKLMVNIAGGRKTMSAYAANASQLLGADEVFHVLTSGPDTGFVGFERYRSNIIDEERNQQIHLVKIPMLDLSFVLRAIGNQLGMKFQELDKRSGVKRNIELLLQNAQRFILSAIGAGISLSVINHQLIRRRPDGQLQQLIDEPDVARRAEIGEEIRQISTCAESIAENRLSRTLFVVNQGFFRQIVDLWDLRGQLDGQIEYNVDDVSDDIILGDEWQLKVALQNLIMNGIQAIQKAEDSPTHCITIKISSNDSYLTIMVADTGIGMDKETAEHVSEPFYTTREEGTGMGCFFVWKIVRDLHLGEVEFSSVKGQGTSFTLTLPRSFEVGVKEVMEKFRNQSLKRDEISRYFGLEFLSEEELVLPQFKRFYFVNGNGHEVFDYTVLIHHLDELATKKDIFLIGEASDKKRWAISLFFTQTEVKDLKQKVDTLREIERKRAHYFDRIWFISTRPFQAHMTNQKKDTRGYLLSERILHSDADQLRGIKERLLHEKNSHP